MQNTALNPTTSTERIQTVDALRGFALFGILLVNMLGYIWPIQHIADVYTWNNLLDKLAFGFIMIFANCKFFPIFSFLFGLGLFMLMERVEARNERFVPLYLRRMVMLLVFGLLHALLFWWGDILHIYAALGIPLLLFRKAKPRIILLFSFVSIAFVFFVAFVADSQPSNDVAMTQANMLAAAEQTIQVYRQGTLAEIMRQHLADFNFALSSNTPVLMPFVFAMFLLGLYAGKRGFFKNIPFYLPLFRRVQAMGLGIGLTIEILLLLPLPDLLEIVCNIMGIFSRPLLGLGYIATIVLLSQKDTWHTCLAPLAVVGRMALTNYLLQTLIMTTILYSYGLRLYAQIEPAIGLLLTVVIYALQIPFSQWWLSHFHFGPMEWLWRSLTYLKWQPLKSK